MYKIYFQKSNLEKLGFSKMTAVQHQTIPLLVSGRDVLVQSQTGSGIAHFHLHDLGYYIIDILMN